METKRLKIGIFIPCSVDQFSAHTGQNMLKLLRDLGYDCYYPNEQACCGWRLYEMGDRNGAKQLGAKLIEQYQSCNYVVSCGSGCVAYMKHAFPSLFYNSTYHNSFRAFTDKLMDISDFLCNVAHYDPSGVVFPFKVVFLDHCQTLRDYGLCSEPRQLLQSINGLELLELPESETCCGHAGFFANNFAPISNELARKKVENALSVGAQYIVSTEMSCLLHLQSYIDNQKLTIKCRHLVDILAS